MRLPLLTSLLIIAGCDYAEPETHLIPEGYVGYVYIVQSRADGEPPHRDGDRRLHRIPPDGLLLTQFASNDGIIDNRYFYVGADGSRREITGRSYSTIHDTPENRADTTLIIQGPSVGSLGNTNVPYQQYFVGTKSDLLDWDHHEAGDVIEALEKRGVVIQ